jgi:hypothetical protein
VAAAGLVVGSVAAYAAVAVHGRGELVADAVETAGLEIDEVRLSVPLTPGHTSDLVFRARNRTGSVLVTDRVTALLPLREAKPAGCTSKVSGPLLGSGMVLGGEQRVVLAPGERQEITIPAAVRLAGSSKTGCGFKVTIDVQAVSAPPTTGPTTRPPTSPTVRPSDPTGPSDPPTSTPPTEPPPTTVNPPTVTPTVDCDPVDPTCQEG